MSESILILGCTASLEEAIKYGSKSDIINRLDRHFLEVEEKEKEIEELERRLELAEEQVFFATTLIDEIESIIDDRLTLKEARKAIDSAISESKLER